MALKITAIIPALNEESNIARCIESVKWCDEIIVMVMGSDNTGLIAKKMGTTVIERNSATSDNFKKVQENINYAIDHAKGDWLLRIDADEVVTPKLGKEIQFVIGYSQLQSVKIGTDSNRQPKTDSEPVAYGIPRKQYFWGGFLTGGDWAYDRLIRLFKKGAARYDPVVSIHEQFKVNGQIGYLSNALEHYSHPTLDVAVKKFNSYTSSQINDMHDTYASAVWKMLTQPPYIFFRWMIWHNGWRDGLRGVVAGLFRAWYEFMLYAKYLEKLRHRIS